MISSPLVPSKLSLLRRTLLKIKSRLVRFLLRMVVELSYQPWEFGLESTYLREFLDSSDSSLTTVLMQRMLILLDGYGGITLRPYLQRTGFSLFLWKLK